MIRRFLLSTTVFVLLGLGFAAHAQSEPLPPPAVPGAPTAPVERTAEDLAAIRAMDEPAMRYLRDVQPRGEYSHFIIPTTISVGIVIDYTNQDTINETSGNIHCSTWLANDRPVYDIIEMDFREYVKNVLPNEWVYNWHPESLRAGAVSAKMFAWWRINVIQSIKDQPWYADDPVRPIGVHVVNNTCDQVFIQNSQRTSTNDAIDYTWPYRLHSNEYVVEIHYLARDYQCAATGWPRCLPQWTTQDMALAGVPWQDMIYQFYSPISISVTDDMPADTNVIRNGNFSEGTSQWTVTGDAQGVGVVDGVFSFYRDGGSTARLRQEIGVLIGQNSPLEFKLMMGNSSDVPKEVTVNIQRVDGGASAGACTFILDPNTPLLKFAVWGVAPSAWSGVRVQISANTSDSTPAYLVDKVKLFYRPGVVPETPCAAPLPGKPKLVTPIANTLYDNDVPVLLTEGKSNYRPGYDAAFHVQVDNNSDFSSPYFDNFGSLANLPELSVYLPGKTWYIRARQFDGIDRFSPWTPTLPFMTDPLPDTPTLVAPVGDVPSIGQSFVWNAGLQTEQYQIVVKNHKGNAVLKAKFTLAEASCDAVCTVALDALPVTWKTAKPYTWFVKAINKHGKAKSTASDFTLFEAP